MASSSKASSLDDSYWAEAPESHDSPERIAQEPRVAPASLRTLDSKSRALLSVLSENLDNYNSRVECLLEKHMQNITETLMLCSRGHLPSDDVAVQSQVLLKCYETDFAALDSAQTKANDLLPEYMKTSRTDGKDGRSVFESMKEQARMSKDQRKRTRDGFAVLHVHRWYSSESWRVFITGRVFEVVVTLLILANAASIGLQSEWGLKNIDKSTPPIFHIANAFFTGILDEAVRAFFTGSPNLTFIRFLRVLRLVKIIRLIRVVRFFHDLRVIVAGILGAMRPLGWACALLFMIMFMVSICFMQLIGEYLPDLNHASQVEILDRFGSLDKSVYTLYISITNGVSWGDITKTLRELHGVLVFVFCAYIAFAVLCVLNIITGVFVENATALSNLDDEQVFIENMEERMAWFEQVKALFDSQVGDSGSLDYEGFKDHMNNIEVQTCFRKLGIDTQSISVKGLFQVLDFDQKGSIEFEEFVLGLQMLHGTAKAIDLARVRHEIKGLKKDIGQLRDKEKARKRALRDTIKSIRTSDVLCQSHAPSMLTTSQVPPFRDTNAIQEGG